MEKIKPRHPEKVKNPINPIKKKPEWIRSKLSDSKEFFLTKTVVNQNNLVTVCQEANCPNITECWSKRHATFMIMGDTCTRACAFCDVKTGKPEKLDPFEHIKIANAVNKLNLRHVVVTSVDRDDLPDGHLVNHLYLLMLQLHVLSSIYLQHLLFLYVQKDLIFLVFQFLHHKMRMLLYKYLP